jgi:hypothetical protein
MGRVYSDHGTWHTKTGEQTIRPLEKEIVIELPIPKKEWQRMALMESMANLFHDPKQKTPNTFKIMLEKFNETRTIRIKGRNVDDLDLEKIRDLIQQANEKSSRFNLRGLLQGLKRSHTGNLQGK